MIEALYLVYYSLSIVWSYNNTAGIGWKFNRIITKIFKIGWYIRLFNKNIQNYNEFLFIVIDSIFILAGFGYCMFG